MKNEKEVKGLIEMAAAKGMTIPDVKKLITGEVNITLKKPVVENKPKVVPTIRPSARRTKL